MDGTTIFALATPSPSRARPGALSVIRLSGPRAPEALAALTGKALPEARRLVLRRVVDPHAGEEIDRALVVWFEAPRTETGEPMAELHLHGGRAVVEAAVAALLGLGFCRPAEPGEFTRRAFESGRLDLTQAEAIADLVAAETGQQRRLALQQMAGTLGRLYEGWRALGVATLAHLEAVIDFPDEDLPDGLDDAVRANIGRLQAEIGRHLADRRGERLRDGLSIAIIGPPNAGKSSLLNLLAGREAAIVSETAGTTRDVIEVHLDLGGWPVVLADTAGLRDSEDTVEQEGVRRARARAEAADLRLLVLDAADDWPAVRRRLVAETAAWDDGGDIVVVNKIDLAPVESGSIVAVSLRTGAGLAELLARLENAAARLMAGDTGAAPLTRARHRAALQECRDALGRALEAPEVAMAAEDVRLAMRALGRITGTVRVEELLDVIFRDFCIGK